MAETVFKFPCPTCGQRVSATPDFIGTEANCPACGVAFIVAAPPAPQVSPELAKLIRQLESEGVPFRPSKMIAEDPESFDDPDAEHVQLIEEFYDELPSLGETINEMHFQEEISRMPTEQESLAIVLALFGKVIDGEWGCTEDETKAFIFEFAPGLRP